MEQSNKWEKLKVVSNAAAIVIIPLVIAFLGNLFSQSMKEKEIQGRFVELSLQILKEKPSDENKNIRKWAVDVINKYSGVKLEQDAAKDLIENVPLPMSDNLSLNFDAPISSTEEPVGIKVSFGYANIGTAMVTILDSANNEIDQFKNTGDLHTLPKLDFKKTSYFHIVIHGTSVDVNPSTNRGTTRITLYQAGNIIADQVIDYNFSTEGGVNTFVAKAKIYLNK